MKIKYVPGLCCIIGDIKALDTTDWDNLFILFSNWSEKLTSWHLGTPWSDCLKICHKGDSVFHANESKICSSIWENLRTF